MEGRIELGKRESLEERKEQGSRERESKEDKNEVRSETTKQGRKGRGTKEQHERWKKGMKRGQKDKIYVEGIVG